MNRTIRGLFTALTLKAVGLASGSSAALAQTTRPPVPASTAGSLSET